MALNFGQGRKEVDLSGWKTRYEPLQAKEVGRARDNIVASIEAFPTEIVDRMHAEGYDFFTLKDLASLATLLEHSTVVFWKNELWTTALKGREAFDGVSPDFANVSPRHQIFIPDVDFDCDKKSCEVLKLGRRVVLTAIFLCNTEESLEICCIFNPSARDQPELNLETYKEFVPAFRFWSFKHKETIVTPIGMMIAALLEFMHQPFVVMNPIVPDRAERRRMIKKGKKWPEVRHIVLRKAIPASHSSQHTTSKKDIDWSCNWLVSSHWRKQYHPSTGERKPKFIQSYLKGDESKPFKPPTRTIIDVKR